MALSGDFIAFVVLASAIVFGVLTFLGSGVIVHRVVALALSFLGMAGLFVLLGAELIAGIQVLVYAGAVSIVIVFALMLTPSHTHKPRTPTWRALAALVGCGAFGGIIWAVLLERTTNGTPTDALEFAVRDVGVLLFGRYALALEIVSVLLTVALIGAIVIGQKQKGGAQ
ncbi:MAG: NADH-quinone oxidoreductase subunit J [Paenibacillaceae bacterium]|jgi:NADH-quinone oxidoreductase subunit J|nr:NADH-quinone oxidoreductase subunit J [Paenibacillaceae bacterium]